MDYLPHGIIGLLFAVMFSAAMSSTASELNALASTTTVDLYKRSLVKNKTEYHYLKSSKYFTFLWGILAIIFATSASLFENLIQAVNLLGSLFYGTILGIFIVAFYFKKSKQMLVFYAAIFAEMVVIIIHYFNTLENPPVWLKMGYLWYNLVGCSLVVICGFLLQSLIRQKKKLFRLYFFYQFFSSGNVSIIVFFFRSNRNYFLSRLNSFFFVARFV